jgi:hypothetical protein
MQTSNKETYQKPVVNQIGSFEEITLGGKSGAKLDATYVVGTPFDDLTFS